ncbi:MAG TPA: hypothetical protein EYG40_12390 [Verrucomicrobia bacterium]|nr:hypothetical protein [Verrucomicrobiales bacterium]HIL55819.1 hypothetical protein [Verrucomicrobiota bacterium]
MKIKFTLLGILATMGVVSAQTATTKPVGYHTETAKGNSFTLMGVNVGNAIAAAGEFDADDATDNDADFTALLDDGVSYTVQNITSGESASVNGNDATTLDTDLAVSSGDSYEVRADVTVGSLLGAANEAGLGAGNATTADVIWIPTGDGFSQVFYDDGVGFPPRPAGWRAIGAGGADQAGTSVPFTAGIFIQRRAAADLDIVFVGHVRTEATSFGVGTGFNFLNRVLPVGVALDDTGLEAFIAKGNSGSGDLVWSPDGNGGYAQYYYTDGGGFPPQSAGWKAVGAGDADKGAETLGSGYAIQRKGEAGSVSVAIPNGLDL